MIKFKTNSGSWKIETPTIERYYQIQSLLALAELNEVQIRIVVALSGAPESEVRSMPTDKFESLWSDIEQGPLAARTDEAFQRIIQIDGQEYGFINVAHLTIGELADLDTIKNHPQSEKQLHRLMAVLYRPIVSKGEKGYEIEPHGSDGYSDRAQLFLEKMEVFHVLAAIDFFFHITKASLSSTMDSLRQTIQETREEMETLSPETIARISKLQEAGQNSSISLQTTTSLKLKPALDSELTTSLTTSLTEKIKQN
jgi:plasmid maintenance system antidote protein VapI